MKTKAINISFLITHYNRPNELFKCIQAIKELKLPNTEIVVSDDCSSGEVLNTIMAFPFDKLIKANENQGLAANINKGLKSCSGIYVIYCQEDFVLHQGLDQVLPECLQLLENKKADMVRLTAYFQFKHLKSLSAHTALIPKFSFRNFLHNFYRYSDHPFIVKKGFFDTYGYYLEHTSGRYGETEYAIRMCNSKVKIAILKTYVASVIDGATSMLASEDMAFSKKISGSKWLLKYLRAFRLYFEWLCYFKNRRGLLTYKNGRAL